MSQASFRSQTPLQPNDFWENNLEQPIADLVAASQSTQFLVHWIEQRSAAEIRMLHYLLGLPAGARGRRARDELAGYLDELRRFVPVVSFALGRSRLAALEVASQCLSEDVMSVAVVGDDEHDTTSLLFAIYDHSWQALEKVFLLEKLHRVGFARMKLVRVPRHPKRSLMSFLESTELPSALKEFDAKQKDKRRCQLRGVFEREGACLVYIRRPLSEKHILVEEKVVHGHSADWIVLEFREEGRLLNVASHGQLASFSIATSVISGFYKHQCEYVNVEEITSEAQLRQFLERLASDQAPELTLLAIEWRDPPIPGFSGLGGHNEGDGSIGEGVQFLQENLGVRLLDGAHSKRLKLGYEGKRVGIEIEPIEAAASEMPCYVVRYRDQTLNLPRRARFEAVMLRDHGIKIVSTKKCKRRSRRSG